MTNKISVAISPHLLKMADDFCEEVLITKSSLIRFALTYTYGKTQTSDLNVPYDVWEERESYVSACEKQSGAKLSLTAKKADMIAINNLCYIFDTTVSDVIRFSVHYYLINMWWLIRNTKTFIRTVVAKEIEGE